MALKHGNKNYYQVLIDRNSNGSYVTNAWSYNSSNIQGSINLPMEMNHAPELVQGTGSGYYVWYQEADAKATETSVSATSKTKNTIMLYDNTSGAFVQGSGGGLYIANDNAYLHLEAEL